MQHYLLIHLTGRTINAGAASEATRHLSSNSYAIAKKTRRSLINNRKSL